MDVFQVRLNLHPISQTRKQTTLDLGWTDHISLTHDLHLQSNDNYGTYASQLHLASDE